LAEACALADRTGLFTCPHTGVALAALFKLVKSGMVKSSERVIVISTAHGLKFTEFKLKYHQSQLEGVTSRLANLPIELPADYATVRDRVLREVEKATK